MNFCNCPIESQVYLYPFHCKSQNINKSLPVFLQECVLPYVRRLEQNAFQYFLKLQALQKSINHDLVLFRFSFPSSLCLALLKEIQINLDMRSHCQLKVFCLALHKNHDPLCRKKATPKYAKGRPFNPLEIIGFIQKKGAQNSIMVTPDYALFDWNEERYCDLSETLPINAQSKFYRTTFSSRFLGYLNVLKYRFQVQ